MMDKNERWELERRLDVVYRQTDLMAKFKRGERIHPEDIDSIRESLDILSGYMVEQIHKDDAAISAEPVEDVVPATPVEDEPCSDENLPSPSAAPIPSGPGLTNSSGPSAPKKGKTRT